MERGEPLVAGAHAVAAVVLEVNQSLAASLARKRPGAAASLHEGLADTVIVNRLGVGGSLRQTLELTNPVESMIEIVRWHARRVKRWHDGDMALRWGRRRHARRPRPVPPRQGLPRTPPARPAPSNTR